jgi:hypothetical protein
MALTPLTARRGEGGGFKEGKSRRASVEHTSLLGWTRIVAAREGVDWHGGLGRLG